MRGSKPIDVSAKIEGNLAPAPGAIAESTPLFTRSFIFANIIYFLSLSNMAIFFNFIVYLGKLGISSGTAGMLLSVFSAVPLITRPFISPYIHHRNAFRWLAVAAAGIICCMGSYAFVTSVAGFYILRCFHGLFFVLLLTALMAMVVSVIPEGKSGQAYSILTMTYLLPYAVLPPMCEWLLAHGLSQPAIYLLSAGAMLSIFPILWFADRDGNPALRSAGKAQTDLKLTRAELLANFKVAPVIVLFALTVITFFGYTMVIFFLKSFAQSIGVEDVGFFFTAFIAVMMAVRLFGSRFLDRVNKGMVVCGTLLFLAGAYHFLGVAARWWHLLAAAGMFGIGFGLIMPILGALIFDMSAPRLRTYNTNMMLEMIDAGYILGPLAAGVIITASGYPAMFAAASFATLFGVLLTPVIIRRLKS